MGRFRRFAVSAAAVLLVSACGGGGDGDQSPRVHYSKLVSFGDSLSDVGTYAVSGVKAVGGGKYTVNGDGVRIWIERLAAQMRVDAPCAAQTGLNAIEGVVGFPAVPVANHPGCFAYGQGGARVTNPVGPGNIATIVQGDNDGALGQLTDPIVHQMRRHLKAKGGGYSGDELVTVLGGGNDVFINLAIVSATVGAGGDPTAAAQAAVVAMVTAAAELAGDVKGLVLAKGAKRVAVVNLPDVSGTPLGLSQTDTTRALILTMVQSFNARLQADLTGVDGVLLIDAFSNDQDQNAHPAQYNLSNVTDVACDPKKVPSSLFCTAATTIAGDVSHYKFADDVHPTPYGYELLAELVTDRLTKAGWL